MKKLKLVVFLLLIGRIVTAQSVDTFLVSNNEIKTFIDQAWPQMTNENTLRLCSESLKIKSVDFFTYLGRKGTIFIQADSSFIAEQIKQRDSLNWNTNLVSGAIFITPSDIERIFNNNKTDGWTVFHKTYGSDFNKLSIPYFSKDKQTCVVYLNHFCGGLCSEGALKIFKRKNGVWRLFKSITIWVS